MVHAYGIGTVMSSLYTMPSLVSTSRAGWLILVYDFSNIGVSPVSYIVLVGTLLGGATLALAT